MIENLSVVDVLLVEDDPGDVVLIKEAFEFNKVHNTLHIVSDGVEALDFLYRRNGHEGAPRPDLVLLDLNLPRKDGRAVLAEIKADEGLKAIPVIVLTTSSAPADVAFCYTHCANSYVRKPLGLDALVEAAAAIRDFWLRTATLPPATA